MVEDFKRIINYECCYVCLKENGVPSIQLSFCSVSINCVAFMHTSLSFRSFRRALSAQINCGTKLLLPECNTHHKFAIEAAACPSFDWSNRYPSNIFALVWIPISDECWSKGSCPHYFLNKAPSVRWIDSGAAQSLLFLASNFRAG